MIECSYSITLHVSYESDGTDYCLPIEIQSQLMEEMTRKRDVYITFDFDGSVIKVLDLGDNLLRTMQIRQDIIDKVNKHKGVYCS